MNNGLAGVCYGTTDPFFFFVSLDHVTAAILVYHAGVCLPENILARPLAIVSKRIACMKLQHIE